ncbi:MAG: deoxyuridine 5'-triphosphate nucleotidohydrolase [Candidatus Micrarchaeota archaeon]
MILNRQEILERILKEKLIQGYTDAKSQLQPAGFDLTVEKVFKLKTQGAIDFDNKGRKISEVTELAWGADGWLELKQGTYKIQFAEEVALPGELAAMTILRSSVMRCGCVMHQGYWDPGYHGKGETALYVGNENGLRLKKGAKIAQMVFFKVAGGGADEIYAGMHQHENV